MLNAWFRYGFSALSTIIFWNWLRLWVDFCVECLVLLWSIKHLQGKYLITEEEVRLWTAGPKCWSIIVAGFFALHYCAV